MVETLIFLSIIIISTSLFTLTQAAAFIIFNIQIKTVQLGYGKPLLKIKPGAFEIEIGWIPGGGVSYEGEQFKQRSIFIRWFIMIVGPLAIFISSAMFLTISDSFNEFIRGYSQLFNLVFHPVNYGQNLFASLGKFLNENNYLISYGVIAAKVTTFNLIPFPNFIGTYFNGINTAER